MYNPHRITLDDVNEALKAKHRILLCSAVNPDVSKRFYAVIDPQELNQYSFVVTANINGTPHEWYSHEAKSMVERYNQL